MKIKYILRFTLLGIGFALTAFGLMSWQAKGFSLNGIWFVDNEFRTHPLHLLVLGIAMIPPTLWEIFVLEQQHEVAPTQRKPAAQTDGS